MMPGTARSLFLHLLAVSWTAFLSPFAILSVLLTGSAATSIWILRRVWSPLLLWAGGVKLAVDGLEHVDPARPTIYVSNHQSVIDVPVLFMAIPKDLRFVAKSQLRWVPFLGWYMWFAGHIFVHRGNPRRTVASLRAAGARIRAGTSIVLFPEGTRSGDGRLLPFKKGAFALAEAAGVPLVPITIHGSGRLMPKRGWQIHPGQIQVRIGAPIIVPEGGAARGQLMRQVRAAMVAQGLEESAERHPQPSGDER